MGIELPIIYFDLYSAQPIGSSKFHGGGEYIKTVYKYLVENYYGACDLVVFYDRDRFLDDWILDLNVQYQIKSINVKSYSDIARLLQENAQNIDTVFIGLPNPYVGIELPNNIYKIGTIHGLRFAEIPVDRYSPMYGNYQEKGKYIIKNIFRQYFIKRALNAYKNIYDKMDKIVVDSNHTYYALKAWFGENSKAQILYVPQRENEFIEILNDECNFDKKFFLMIGVNRWEKNSYRAIMAFEELFEKNLLSDYNVVICGNLSKSVMGKIHHKEKYIFKGYVSTQELENLYYHCSVFVYPTLNEGFGMPPLEAMKYGTTCVVSSVCSLPELCGDAVYWCNPFDTKEIENRLLWAISSPKNPDIVKRQYWKVYDRQVADIKRICELIVKGDSSE